MRDDMAIDHLFYSAGVIKHHPYIVQQFQVCNKIGTDAWRENHYFSDRPRSYHNLQHLIHLWQYLWPKIDSMHIRSSALFVVFHDWVYFTKSNKGDSESVSITAMLSNMGEQNVFNVVDAALGIHATTNHTMDQDWLPEHIKHWLDADLAGLASPYLTYCNNSQNIRAELDCTDEEWLQGRAVWINAMMQRKHIFYHDADLEEAARQNLISELYEIELSLSGKATKKEYRAATGRRTESSL